MKTINLFFAIVLLTGCTGTTNTAVIPTDKIDVKWWKERHEEVMQQIREKDPQLILIGNSITHALDDESNIEFWEKYLDQYNTVNMGFGGDRTENVIWRLENGEIDGINPKVATLLIGTNNLDGNHYSEITDPEDLAEGIWKICKIISEKLPETEIALLAILPYGSKPEVYHNRLINETNDIIKHFPNKNSRIHYFDVGHVLLNDEGRVRRDLMPDYLHPNTEGYRLIFDALTPEIEKLMNN
jgi:beta-glucosidase